jgi:hypothetical protein
MLEKLSSQLITIILTHNVIFSRNAISNEPVAAISTDNGTTFAGTIDMAE